MLILPTRMNIVTSSDYPYALGRAIGYRLFSSTSAILFFDCSLETLDALVMAFK